MNKKTILICDDEGDSREVLKNILSRRGYTVYTAGDGKESLEKTRELSPDVLLLDIRMPKIDGVEVIKKIRTFDKKVKIVFVTAFHSPELSQEVSKYDISDYIVKPASLEKILESIKEAIGE